METKQVKARKPRKKAALVTIKLVDNYPRSKLIEGRNYGIGFALAKKTDTAIELVGPISPCKDYLNDQVYTENTKKPYGAWGYHASYQGLLDGEFGYVVIAVLPYFGGSKYGAQDQETAWLNDHTEDIAVFVRRIEELLKIPLLERTRIGKMEENRYACVISKWWLQYPYLISLWGLLVRIALESSWTPEAGDPMTCLEKCKTGDSMKMMTAMPKLKHLIEKGVVVQDYNAGCGWHDAGICDFEFSKS
jgi:hypothetical protein